MKNRRSRVAGKVDPRAGNFGKKIGTTIVDERSVGFEGKTEPASTDRSQDPFNIVAEKRFSTGQNQCQHSFVG
ncbi:MAG: hypothetical protein V2A73_02570 [Pseudomonadota bacterium]